MTRAWETKISRMFTWFVSSCNPYIDGVSRYFRDNGEYRVRAVHGNFEEPSLSHFLQLVRAALRELLQHVRLPCKHFEHSENIQAYPGVLNVSNEGVVCTVLHTLWVTASTRLSVWYAWRW